MREVLEDKHLEASPAHPDILLDDMDNDSYHPAIFENITGESIRTAALHTQGAAGPSGLDAYSWRRLCTAFGQRSNDLCTAMALVALDESPHRLLTLVLYRHISTAASSLLTNSQAFDPLE